MRTNSSALETPLTRFSQRPPPLLSTATSFTAESIFLKTMLLGKAFPTRKLTHSEPPPPPRHAGKKQEEEQNNKKTKIKFRKTASPLRKIKTQNKLAFWRETNVTLPSPWCGAPSFTPWRALAGPEERRALQPRSLLIAAPRNWVCSPRQNRQGRGTYTSTRRHRHCLLVPARGAFREKAWTRVRTTNIANIAIGERRNQFSPVLRLSS